MTIIINHKWPQNYKQSSTIQLQTLVYNLDDWQLKWLDSKVVLIDDISDSRDIANDSMYLVQRPLSRLIPQPRCMEVKADENTSDSHWYL